MKVQTGSRSPVAWLSLFGSLCLVLALFGLVALTRNQLPVVFSSTTHGLESSADRPSIAAPLGVLAAPASLGSPPIARLEQIASVNQIACSLAITTTDKAPLNNRSFATAATVANYTDQSLVNGVPNETHTPWEDYYRLDNSALNYRYTIQAKPDWTTNYNLGMVVYDEPTPGSFRPIITDTDTTDYGANISFIANHQGPYFFKVFQVSEQCAGHTYSLILASQPPPTATPSPIASPTPLVSPVPQPTWMAGYDQYEPNYSFELATTIAPAVAYTMNFVPWGGALHDNDYLKVRVKPGLQLTCYTSNLDPGVDPRMVFYTGPGDQYFVMANDDIELGNFNSRLSYYANYEGWLYILIGQGERMERRDTTNSDYTITCDLAPPGAPTPLPGAPTPGSKAPVVTPVATATPGPTPSPTPPQSPIDTPTPPTSASGVEMTFRLVTTPEPVTATPEPNGFRTFRVLVYFDENLDGVMGAGEGVPGFFVLVLTPDGRSQLAQGYTDEQGQLSFTVPTVSTVRILVPLLGYDRLVDATRPEVRVRIVPPALPDTIP